MNIEIVDFHPEEIKKNLLRGTLHVYVIDLDLDYRGIVVTKRNLRWHFLFPIRKAIDADTKQKVFYPIISFANREKNTIFKKEIIEKGKAFIIKKLKENHVQIIHH